MISHLMTKPGVSSLKEKITPARRYLCVSVGLAQLFTQAGLPVAAESAEISIKSGIYSMFASKEKKDESGGRFEQEVQGVAELVELADHDSLIFFNEIFQSTSTTDGENALLDLLGYFVATGSEVIAVTHLNGVFDRIPELTESKEFMLLQTFDNQDESRYKLHQVTNE